MMITKKEAEARANKNWNNFWIVLFSDMNITYSELCRVDQDELEEMIAAIGIHNKMQERAMKKREK